MKAMFIFLVLGVSLVEEVVGRICNPFEQCVSIKTCQPVVLDLKVAQLPTTNNQLRLSIINNVKSNICGTRRDRMVCCVREQLQAAGQHQPANGQQQFGGRQRQTPAAQRQPQVARQSQFSGQRQPAVNRQQAAVGGRGQQIGRQRQQDSVQQQLPVQRQQAASRLVQLVSGRRPPADNQRQPSTVRSQSGGQFAARGQAGQRQQTARQRPPLAVQPKEQSQKRKQAIAQQRNQAIEEERKQAIEQDRKQAIEQQRKQAIEQQRKQAVEQERKLAIEQERKQAIEQQRKQAIEQQRKQAIEQRRKQAIEQERKQAVEQQRKQAIEQQRKQAIEQQRKQSSSTSTKGSIGTKTPVGQEEFLGSFVNVLYDIKGDVYAVGNSQIRIVGLNYKGGGPDAFLLAGRTDSSPSHRGDIVLPIPFRGVHFAYDDPSIPILRKVQDEDFLFPLPPGATVDQLRWISVWCREVGISFGHAIL